MSIHNLSNHIYSPSELMREHPYFFSIRELLMNSCKIRKRSDFIISFFCYNIDKPSKEMDIEIIMQSNILLFLFFSIIAALIIRFLPPSRKKKWSFLFKHHFLFIMRCQVYNFNTHQHIVEFLLRPETATGKYQAEVLVMPWHCPCYLCACFF